MYGQYLNRVRRSRFIQPPLINGARGPPPEKHAQRVEAFGRDPLVHRFKLGHEIAQSAKIKKDILRPWNGGVGRTELLEHFLKNVLRVDPASKTSTPLLLLQASFVEFISLSRDPPEESFLFRCRHATAFSKRHDLLSNELPDLRFGEFCVFSIIPIVEV